MPRLIIKCPYLKGKNASAHLENYTRYIATRDGVEIPAADLGKPATKKQQNLIADILRDMPDVKSLHEYDDYAAAPTIGNASDFITQALEQNLQMVGGNDYYVKYIAERPRVEKLDSHGLFGAKDDRIVLSQVQAEVSAHTGNVWTPIISLRREDAARLGVDNAAAWQDLLRLHAVDFAKQMKIAPEHFRWYAAFHNESHHPHVHMICWSTDPSEGFLTVDRIEKLKSVLARDIFEQDLISIYQEQTIKRDDLRQQSSDVLSSICKEMAVGTCDNPVLETLLREISEKLPYKGKMQYGFMQPSVKNLIDAAVDELAKDERVASCYDEWYSMRNEVYHTYTDNPPPKLPLSQQKEFKPIKNMLIQQVIAIRDMLSVMPILEQFHHEIVQDLSSPETEPLLEEADPHASWTAGYKRARSFLFGSKGVEPDFEQAHELLLQEAHSGNAFAMHDLGRMYADGLGMDTDSDATHQWYQQALDGFHQIESAMDDDERGATYLRYRIGKMYVAGLGTEQDYSKAASWLEQAADDEHKYAQYSLGSLYYRSRGVAQDFAAAFDLYSKSAAQGNAYASYELGKMHRDGIGTVKNERESQSHFQIAFNSFVAMEMEGSDDRLQYRIGQMLRDGVGTKPNVEEAIFYFERSAALGNPHAQYALAKHYLKSGEPEKVLAALGLLQKSAAENPMAQYALGKLYRDGVDGVIEPDISKAIEYFTKAATQENDFAAYALGRLYLDGERIQQNIPTALHWLDKAAEQRNQFAQYTLGKAYLAGELIPKDVPAAVEFLTRSAEQGNQFAQYTLGKLYLMGKEVVQDREQARRWLEQAAAQGNEYAQFFLDHFDEIGNRNPDLFIASTNLLRQLSKIFEDQHKQLQGQIVQIDRKRLRVLREKKLAQGHAYDDREPKQT